MPSWDNLHLLPVYSGCQLSHVNSELQTLNSSPKEPQRWLPLSPSQKLVRTFFDRHIISFFWLSWKVFWMSPLFKVSNIVLCLSLHYVSSRKTIKIFQCQVIFTRYWLNTPKKDTECWPLLIDLSQPNWSMQKYKESKGIDRQKKNYLIYQLKLFSSGKEN